MRKTFITIISLFVLNGAVAQSVSTYTTTESVAWKKAKQHCLLSLQLM